MDRIYGVCESCDSILAVPIGFGEGVTATISMTGSLIFCKCGGKARIPDGIYRRKADGIIEVLQASGKSKTQLERLEQLLRTAKKEKSDSDAISAILKKEAPELITSGYLPKNRAELYAFIALILTAIQLLLSQLNKPETPVTNINQTINISTGRNVNSGKVKIVGENDWKSKQRTFNRNATCRCGSKKKYKQCCGRAAGRSAK